MSKIQEALKRIQSNDDRASRKSGDKPSGHSDEGSDSKSLAELTHVDLEALPGAASGDGRLIVVDRVMLTQAGLLAPEAQKRYMADQFRLLKRPILDNVSGLAAADSDDPMNLIMVASALPGDGKTFNCLNLALSIATEKDTSVLLVDADVAKPHISSLFGVEDELGLIDLLKQDGLSPESAIIPTDVPGLSVLPAGKPDSSATELLASRRMASTVDYLSNMLKSRVVIFDSPPILATSEARVLAKSMGQIMMVVRAGHTPQHAVVEALESLDHSKAINLVLNQSAAGLGSDGYGRYGFAYGYGHSS